MRAASALGRGFTGVGLVLALAAPATSGTLATAPFSSGFGGPVTGIDCALVNVGTKQREVTIEVLDGDAVVATAAFGVVPGDTFNVSHFATGSFYCRFLFKGSAKGLRAAAHAVDGAFSPYAIEPAR